MELFTFWRNSEFLIESYTLENSFCHFSRVHEKTNYKDPIIARMYGAILFMSWKLGFWELLSSHPTQREIRGDTCVSTCVKSDCTEYAKVPDIAIRIDTLIISVSARMWHTRYHILFDAVSWLIDFLVSGCLFVMCNIRDSSWFSGNVTQKKTGTFTFLSETENPYLKRVHKIYMELTQDFGHFERSFSTKVRLIFIRSRELQVIITDLQNFIKRLDSIFLVEANSTYN